MINCRDIERWRSRKKTILIILIIVSALLISIASVIGRSVGVLPNSVSVVNQQLKLGYHLPHWGQTYKYRDLPSLNLKCECGDYLGNSCDLCEIGE